MVKILSRYADLREFILKYAEVDVRYRIKPADIGMENPDIQKCYRDIKKLGFKGDVVDYVNWISFRTILIWWDAQVTEIIRLDIKKREKVQEIHNCLLDVLRAHVKEAASCLSSTPVAEEILDTDAGKYVSSLTENNPDFITAMNESLTVLMMTRRVLKHKKSGMYGYLELMKTFDRAKEIFAKEIASIKFDDD